MTAQADWGLAPPDAQSWAPDTAKFMSGFYKTDNLGRWYFATSRNSGWWRIDAPPAYRRRQMERRPRFDGRNGNGYQPVTSDRNPAMPPVGR